MRGNLPAAALRAVMMELVNAVPAYAVMANAVASGEGRRDAHQRQKGCGKNFLHGRIVA
jgi:hypothetical protein